MTHYAVITLLAIVAVTLAWLVVTVRRRVRHLELWMTRHDSSRIELLEVPRRRRNVHMHLEGHRL